MPVDWEKYEKDLDDAIENAGARTDKKLAGKIALVTKMSEEEIMKFFPKAEDAQKLSELIKIVKDSTRRNEKIDNIVSNAEKFGGVILTLLQKLL